MMNFLRNLFRPRRDRGRCVFRYFDGSKSVGADPLKLKAALDVACPDWAKLANELLSAERVASGVPLPGKLADELDRRRAALVGELVRATRAAFAVKEYGEDGSGPFGLTDMESLNLLADYLAWVAEVMEDARPLATSPPGTDSAASGSPSASGSASPSTPAASATST